MSVCDSSGVQLDPDQWGSPRADSLATDLTDAIRVVLGLHERDRSERVRLVESLLEVADRAGLMEAT